MTDELEGYDRIAEGYSRWWAPVIAPLSVRPLDRIEPLVEAGATSILDVGTGSGTVAIAAIRRWPRVRVTGIDASREMAAMARRLADAELGRDDRRRFEVRPASADRLPFGDRSFDAAVSSFVLQLVPSRHGALREVRRVLADGGRFAHATWLSGSDSFRPDRVVDRVLDEVGIGPREPGGPSGDYRGVEAAVASLRRAGFRGVVGERMELAHRFDVEGYAGFIEEFDEESTFGDFAPRERVRVSRRLRHELRKLPPEDFVLRLPVVVAHGDRG